MLGDEWVKEMTRRALGRRPVRAIPVEPRAGAGNTAARRLLVETKDGSRAFVKAAADPATLGWLRIERQVYAAVEGPFLPRFLGWWEGDGAAVLVLEDLSDAHWPPPWREGDVEAVRAAVADANATAPPPGLPDLEDVRGQLEGWGVVLEDPGPFVSLGVASAEWLDRHGPHLGDAAAAAPLAGDALLHFDVRSDNVCIRGAQALLVDWNWACVGNPLVDLVGWAPSLRVEGGPEPEDLVPDETGEIAAFFAGYFAARAGLPPLPGAPHVRRLQREQLEVALPWACRRLGVPQP